MRERLALLREYLKNRLAFGKNKKTRKGFILTMVALVEVLAISVVSVSAWVETISTITIKAEGAKIDNYVYTNADIGSGNGYSGKTIDLTKYFRAAGGVHLALASSADGENIFFPIKKSDVSDFGANSYRCADVNDKNVNYIDFSFNVKVDKTFNANHAEFYLDQVPKITIGGADVSGNLVRMAITDTDTQNTVVCGSEASNKNVVSKAEGNQTPETVRAFSDFVVNPESEPTELFRVDKGSSKTINIKVWLQDDKATTEYAGKTVSISGVNIVTQNKKGNKVYFVDRTVNEDIKNWTKGVTFQQGDKTPVTMKFNENSHTYSCNYIPAEENTVVKFTSEGGVTWTTNMKSLNSGESMYYTAYGNHNNSNAGYGTWGEVIEISVSSKTDVLPDTGNVSSVYMVPDKNDSYSKVRMPFTNDRNKWVGYIAKEKADDMTFSFTNNNKKYEIPAPNRGNSTHFVVTSATTGYWDPPATITVTAGKNDAGDPKVSYDSLKSTTISVTPGTKVKLEANPKTGFVLKNWVISGTSTVADGIGSDGSFTPTASGNYNFTAVYVESLTFEAYVRTYDGASLSENTNGGSVEIKCGNQNSTVDSNDGTHITLNAVKGSTVTYYAKAKDGYVFDGWYTDADCNSKPENSSDKYELANVEASKKLYAKFKVDTYTVKAYAQHGNNPPSGDAGNVSFDNNNYASEVTTTVKRNGEVIFYAKPESGYAFIGWYKSETAPEPTIAVKDCFLDNGVYSKKMTIQYSDVKTYALYARFKALCTVEAKAMYNNENVDEAGTVKVADRAAGKSSSKPVMEGDNVTVEAIAKKGYKFAGWYTDMACNKPYSTENNDVSLITLNNVSKGITLYAKFELETGVTFYLNDGGLWSGDKAKLAAYVWDDNGNKKWLEVSKTDYDNYYSFALDNNQWKQVIFVRYDPSKNLNDFPTKDWNGYVWNKTSDITIDYNNNCYVITSSPNNGGSSTGYWTSYTPGQTANIDIYVYTGNCSWFDHDSAVLAYRFSTDDSFKSDCTKVTKDGKTYWKLSIPTDKDTIYLSRAALGGHHNEFNTSIDKSKNLFTVNNDFNGGDWSTY
ncbi:InlB B-repeat-containing protein [Ruminococcus bromii]|nr:InlB B-repeat-containing protein [Ruminococcus bromii]MDT4342625.1 InlB B-repeat-containing protein [Ruminococcus bromii]